MLGIALVYTVFFTPFPFKMKIISVVIGSAQSVTGIAFRPAQHFMAIAQPVDYVKTLQVLCSYFY